MATRAHVMPPIETVWLFLAAHRGFETKRSLAGVDSNMSLNRAGERALRASRVCPGHGWIMLRFRTGAEYHYTVANAGAQYIAEMHRRAREGQGLNNYIQR